MDRQTSPGRIEVVCGSMFSGKTEELVRRLKRAQIARQKVQVFKHSIDTRYSDDHVQSHDASKILSIPVQNSSEILEKVEPNTRVVGIDEAQFFDLGIASVAETLAFRGVRVIVAGLDLDFRGEPFGPMPRLLAVAEQVTKLAAVCMVCGGQASRSQRLPTAAASQPAGKAEDRVLVGALDLYEARCRFCHEPNIERLAPVSPPSGDPDSQNGPRSMRTDLTKPSVSPKKKQGTS